MSGKFERMNQLAKDRQEVKQGKEDTLEKHDFLALNKAAFSVFMPIVLGALGILAAVILLFTLIFR